MVYDTNVVVSAALTPGSIPASLVDLALGKQVRLFYSLPVFEEYQEVLARPKFGLPSQVVSTLLERLKAVGVRVNPRQRVRVAPHEPDNRFLECAKTARAHYLVTGNKRHFPFPDFAGTKIISPAEFARVVAEQMYYQTKR